MIFPFSTFITQQRSTRIALLAGLLAVFGHILQADAGIVVYGSKGLDQRRTDSGHISLIVTDLCAKGIDQVRLCQAGEARGIVVNAYANLASDYKKAVIVMPLLDHFAATSDPEQIPVLTNGASLRSAQITYWREHLRQYIPPMSQQRYTELRADLEEFDAGRTVRRFLTMEFIGTLMGSHKQQDPTEPIALIDPQTKELIPEGRWREAVGAEHMRSAIVMTAPATVTQELRLVQYLQHPPFETFNVMAANCSDFVKGALLAIYEEDGLRFRPRQWDFADAWVTSPLWISTGFASYLTKNDIPMRVVFVPIIAGTRRSHFSVYSLSRGALVPHPSQGKLAFALKTYFNFLNPLLGITSFTVDQVSRFVNLPRLIHDCSAGDLMTVGTDGQACAGDRVDSRDRVRVFGTSSCWRNKQDLFQTLASQAMETGLLEPESKRLVLKRGQPFLFARLYEHPAGDKSRSHSLLQGMQSCPQPTCGVHTSSAILSSVPVMESEQEEAIPGRPKVRLMADSSETTSRQTAFKLIASVVNYDLSSEPADRRSVQSFDADWQLLVHAAQENNLIVPTTAAETLEACSCHSFDAGTEQRDALQVARGFSQTIPRAEREFVNSPVR